MMVNDQESVGNLLLFCLSRPEVEIRQDRLRAACVWIAIIIPPQAVIEGDVRLHLPRILHEKPVRNLGGVPEKLNMLAAERIVCDAALGVDIVLGELKQAVELKGSLIVWAILGLHVVSQEAFITRAQIVGFVDVSQNIAPMVVMLNEVA